MPDRSPKEPPPAALVVPERWRASQVYDAIDEALVLPPRSTRESGAQHNAMNVYQALTIAGTVQAEADAEAATRATWARSPRLSSTGWSAECRCRWARRSTTRQRMGLPPTPIDNPGEG
ncbi:hypothetical protein [Streptomyces sp. IMTB 2501]|uniref:hypothetical protein n=1 Tax=Streptomyces sp. IMTB 2501 TaxID=1776340 RepID=UPI0035325283